MTLLEPSQRAVPTVSWRDLPGPLVQPPRLCLVDFIAKDFTVDFFPELGIACPSGIARSVPKRQAEFLYGRLATRLALAAIGAPVVDINIGPSREPLWPEGIIGSITHIQGLAAAVVLEHSCCAGIGIDIEQVLVPEIRNALLSTAINPAEWACIQTNTIDHDIFLTIAFSSKESLFKAAFSSVGRFFDFKAAEVIHVDIVKRRLSLMLTETLSSKLVAGCVVYSYFELLNPNTVLTNVVLI